MDAAISATSARGLASRIEVLQRQAEDYRCGISELRLQVAGLEARMLAAEAAP